MFKARGVCSFKEATLISPFENCHRVKPTAPNGKKYLKKCHKISNCGADIGKQARCENGYTLNLESLGLVLTESGSYFALLLIDMVLTATLDVNK